MQPDRVRPDGRAQGEGAARLGGMARGLEGEIASRSVEPGEEMHRLSGCKARQRRPEGLGDLDMGRPAALAGLAEILRTFRTRAMERAHAADEGEARIVGAGGIEGERHLAGADRGRGRG